MQSHIHKMHACLVVTCHLHFWQNDRDLLCATAVTQGWNRYPNKSQHRKLTLEKNIFPPLLQGLEPVTIWSWVWHSSHWVIPTPPMWCFTVHPLWCRGQYLFIFHSNTPYSNFTYTHQVHFLQTGTATSGGCIVCIMYVSGKARKLNYVVFSALCMFLWSMKIDLCCRSSGPFLLLLFLSLSLSVSPFFCFSFFFSWIIIAQNMIRVTLHSLVLVHWWNVHRFIDWC